MRVQIGKIEVRADAASLFFGLLTLVIFAVGPWQFALASVAAGLGIALLFRRRG